MLSMIDDLKTGYWLFAGFRKLARLWQSSSKPRGFIQIMQSNAEAISWNISRPTLATFFRNILYHLTTSRNTTGMCNFCRWM